MPKRPKLSNSAGSMSHIVPSSLTPGAENWWSPRPFMREEHRLVYSPNPEQDYIHAQGTSPRCDFDHSDHILDQPDLYLFDDHERAALQMEGWSPSWNPQCPGYPYWLQSQVPGPSQVPQQPEDLPIHWPAHVIGSQKPISDQLVRQQHVYYTNPATPAEHSGSEHRGGTVPGTNLSKDGGINSREVREVGACLRCWAMKGRCSRDDPCNPCTTNNNGRKWMGCFRSFSQAGDSIIPSMLANRLSLASYENWMMMHTSPDIQGTFSLPLSFGFGKVFHGFLGCEFTPLTDESMHSYSVRKGKAQCVPGLPIFATYKGSGVPRSLKRWLKETLRDGVSMSQWRRACFRGEQDIWIRRLLKTAWEYSYTCWTEENQNSQCHQINEMLSHAWSMTLLATILSFQITVPAEDLGGVVNMLRPPRPECTTNSSRQINKGVKCVLFEIYQKIQKKVISQVDDIVKNSKTMNDREWGNMYCVSILLIVIISQAQLSLQANYVLAEREQRGEQEETKRQLEELEAAFRTIAHSFAFAFREKEKERQSRPSDAGHDPITSRLLEILGHIQGQYRDEIQRYRKEKLTMNTHRWFSTANRLRFFSYYFHALPKSA
ncbi:uncharacterized protein TRUGW13939_00679 [Talaromyces rugulosus]|uniref:Zn(2)-C6 fungal-type domain-containing protein n=1 Tax=Talaromyces rugulosus TaxID=121627 RepID=A0A7H8QI76_TALRU|nr:uncharacterized protein TRUGW13939_00679 [Talaromyces rugulosus]QKX53600.1 hypothetical protein TRUGW13939_00679 [Talaromyces rugulosus]